MTPETPAICEPGIYERDGFVFLVKPNRAKTRVYAKRLVFTEIGERATESGERLRGFDFEYAPGAIYTLHPEHRMPVARAKELTLRYGRCIICGAYLKDAKSVERGIGPICIRYCKREDRETS